MAVFNGTSGDDVYAGTTGTDTISGNGGADLLFGDAGSDTITGGAGDDIVLGGTGSDNVNGGDNNDVVADNDIFVDNGFAIVIADSDQDTLSGGNGDDYLLGGVSDIFDGGSGIDTAMIDLGALTGITVDLRPLNTGLTATLPGGGSIRNVEGGIALYLGLGNNTVFGSQFAEEIYGWTGNDTFDGGAGNDYLDGWTGNDNLSGGDGIDVLLGGAGTDTLNGGNQNDTIDGGADNDVINGGDGDDAITSLLGADSIDGGAGFDYAQINRNTVVVNLNISTTAMASALGQIWADGTFVANLERFDIGGGSGADTLTVGGPLLGVSHFNGGAGMDRFSVDLSSFTTSVTIDTNSFTWGATLTMSNVEALTVTTGSGNDFIYGFTGDDVINSGGGDDTINAHLGVANINGGSGFDFVEIQRGGISTALNITTAGMASALGETWADGSSVAGIERFIIYAGAGNDTLTVTSELTGSSTFSGGDGTDRVIADLSSLNVIVSSAAFAISWGSTSLSLGSIETLQIQSGSANDYLVGGAGNDTLSGGGGADRLDGDAGADIVNGEGGDDVLTVSVGGDTVDGGAGIDGVTILRENSALNYTFDFTAMSSASGATLADGSVVRNVEYAAGIMSGSGDDTLILSAIGVGTNNVANLGAGNDRLVADFSATSTELTFTPGELRTSANNAWQLLLGLIEQFDITFGNGGDSITGGAGNDQLRGGGGNDTFWGTGGGVDLLDGGAGNDWFALDLSATSLATTFDGAAFMSATGATLADGSVIRNMEGFDIRAGSGDDTLTVTNIQRESRFIGGGGNDRVVADFTGRSEQIVFSINEIRIVGVATLIAIAESIEVTGGSNNDEMYGYLANDTFRGGDGNDRLDAGSDGLDRLYGGAGDDDLTAFGTGADIVDGGDGVDNLYLGRQASALTYNISTSQLASAGVTLVDGTVISSIERYNIYLGSGNDTFTVDTQISGENYYFGNSGIDTFNANFSWSNQAITLFVSEVFASYVQNASFNLALSAIEVFNVTGGSANDTLLGGSRADILDGGGGADTITAGGGNDSVLGGDGNDTLSGGLGADSISGQDGNDTINYVIGDGNDTISGGDGVDTLNISDGANGNLLTVIFEGPTGLTNIGGITAATLEVINVDMGGGVDWLIYSPSSTEAVSVNLALGTASGFTSVAGIERVIGTSYNDTITGDALDNRLDGALGNDTLVGGGGVDTILGGDGADAITGGLGNDSLNGGQGSDTYNWTVGDGRDTISDSGSGVDTDILNAFGSANADLGNVTFNGGVAAFMDNALIGIEAINLDLGGGVDWLIYNSSLGVTVNLATHVATGFSSVINVEKVIGGSGGDTLTGDGLDNRLDGQGGNDILDGGLGSDSVIGGDGNDTIYASAGNDPLQGQNGNDTFIWTSTDGRDTFNGGADFDTLNMTGSANPEVARANWNGTVITGLLDNALVDIEAVHLDLGAGGSGGDWLQYNSTLGISVNLDAGTATGFASITGVENVIGGTGADTIIGDAGSNKINANDGDDRITGGGGADNLTGGLGSDTFVYAAGAGNDTINDFDAWAVGGQDFLDVTGFGITSGDFASRIAIIDTGNDTVIRIDGNIFITLKNVSGDGDNVMTIDDFILA